MTMTIALTLALSALLAQIPNPGAAIGAAKDARAKTEAAQKKNSEALDQKPAPPPPPPAQAPAAPAAPAAQGAKPPAGGAGYSYDPAGRRDPFVSLTARGGELPSAGGARPSGPAGLLVSEITLKGVLKSSKGGFLALVQAPDNRTYIVHSGDKVFDGTVKAITQDAVVFSQDVNDPLSLVKQREVRKAIRPEAR
jgi:type IV pilus assembly protein PilP